MQPFLLSLILTDLDRRGMEMDDILLDSWVGVIDVASRRKRRE